MIKILKIGHKGEKKMRFKNMECKTEVVMMGRYKLCLAKITPELAEEMLKKNTKNRAMRRATVNVYSEDMMNDRWNGISIIAFNEETGELMDGQHRLMAIARSGVAQIMAVAEVKKEDVFDIGATRSVRDIMALQDMDNISNTLIGAISLSITRNNSCRVSKTKVIERYLQDKDRWDFAGKVGKGIAKKGAFVVAIYFAHRCGVDEKTLERFSEIVGTGFYEGEEDVCGILCRNMLMEAAGKSKFGWDFVGKIEEYIRLFNEGECRKYKLRTPTWCYSKRVENK